MTSLAKSINLQPLPTNPLDTILQEDVAPLHGMEAI